MFLWQPFAILHCFLLTHMHFLAKKEPTKIKVNDDSYTIGTGEILSSIARGQALADVCHTESRGQTAQAF